jgi:hypothetical protein
LTFKEVDCTEARSEASAEVLAVLYKALGSRLQAVCDLIYIDIIEYQQVKIEGFHRSANAVDKRERSVIATAIDEDKMLIFTVFVAVDIETCLSYIGIVLLTLWLTCRLRVILAFQAPL